MCPKIQTVRREVIELVVDEYDTYETHNIMEVVSGHTDNYPIRTKEYPPNLDLSSARAITVAKFLIKNGVEPHRVSIQGFSEYRPLFANISPENHEKNRRVEITLIKKSEEGKAR